MIMEAADALLEWAEENDVQMNGVHVVQIPGRGAGVVASRRIEVSKEFSMTCWHSGLN